MGFDGCEFDLLQGQLWIFVGFGLLVVICLLASYGFRFGFVWVWVMCLDGYVDLCWLIARVWVGFVVV